jgi:hypothetical protein
MNIDAKTSPPHWRIEDILLYLNNNVKKSNSRKSSTFYSHTKRYFNLESSGGDCLSWDIPVTNIDNLLQYALLPYNYHIPEPRGLDLFTKGLASWSRD